MNSVALDNLPIGWFDIIVLAVLVTGGLRGRRHGMSTELLPMLRWISAVVIAGLCYKPLGLLIEHETLLSKLASFITAYLGCLLLVFIGFAVLKKLIGGKPISAERFGKGEYYLGVLGGMVTVSCMLVVALSFLNARKYTTKEIQDRRAYEQDVYGSHFFPTLDSVQTFVFKRSFAGAVLQVNARSVMIEPTVAKPKNIQRKEWTMPEASS